jgi:multicomponent K+:H+ antiporter subunit D
MQLQVMQHLAILPIIMPMFMAAFLVLPPLTRNIAWQRFCSVITVSVTLIAATLLLLQSAEITQVYSLGGWQAPFGIVLVADPLAAIMVTLTSFLCLGALIYGCAGEDLTGMYFHPLFLFQLAGLNGAFLTGDIFNLFVFFEVLLIASYALLIHGGGKEKTQASVHYVTLNLIGSAFFLFALGILYGTLGTLNMADMASKISGLGADERQLAKAGGLMLLVVFGLKTAMVPLHFWLPRTYISAAAPIAALFAIMTKVGIYSIYRIHTGIFGETAGALAYMATPWLWPMAVLTIAVGILGVLASQQLKELTANLVIISVGTLLFSIALHRESATSAGIFYLIHSTLVTAALFLICDLVSKNRGKALDRLVPAKRIQNQRLISVLFFIAALTVIGMPPFSGFIGKTLLLQSAQTGAEMAWIWSSVLISSLAALIALSRAGTTVFWKSTDNSGSFSGARRQDKDAVSISGWQVCAIALLLLASPFLVITGGIITDFIAVAATQLHQGIELAPIAPMLSEGGL